MTYTFTLKDGVKFGPPLDRAITSADVAYAFQRINTKALVAQYGFYYDGMIEGMDGSAKSADQTISGIETPDAKTITFHLTQPTGDFLYRLAMPATAPMPKEVAGCFTKAGDYGRNSSCPGPYMILGSDQVDASSCDTIQPIAGFDPTKFMKIVRNPDYDPSTDSPDVRSNYLDGVDIEIDTNTDDIFNKIQAGAGRFVGKHAARDRGEQYLNDPALKPMLHSDPGDRTWYVFMNLLTPPFDDIHVRKAVNFIIDKAAIQKVWGGPIHGDIASHIMPPTVLPGFPADYDPYASAGNAGDETKAKDEMKQATKYDTNGDGVCDVDACKDVLLINRSSPPQVDMTPILTTDLAKIGITLKARELDTSTAYTTIATVDKLIPIGANAGWGKDYADPSTFAVLFQSSGIACSGGINYSNVGMTAAQAKECGVTDAFNAATAPRPPERRQRGRSVQPGLGRRADPVLDQARPGPHGERGSVGPVPVRERADGGGQVRHQVRVRPVLRDHLVLPRRREQRRAGVHVGTASAGTRDEEGEALRRGAPPTPSRGADGDAMGRYIIRRLLWVVFVLLAISLITYVIFFVMPPTDPSINFAGKQPTPELIAEVKAQFGLDKPL